MKKLPDLLLHFNLRKIKFKKLSAFFHFWTNFHSYSANRRYQLVENDTGLRRRPICNLQSPKSIFDEAFFIECWIPSRAFVSRSVFIFLRAWVFLFPVERIFDLLAKFNPPGRRLARSNEISMVLLLGISPSSNSPTILFCLKNWFWLKKRSEKKLESYYDDKRALLLEFSCSQA